MKQIITRVRALCAVLLLGLTAVTGTALRAQTVYHFTPAGASGTSGPSQTQVNTAYTATTLAGQVTVSGGIQQWIVPVTGLYIITASGASGGYTANALGGQGRKITTQINLTAGQVLNILVGQVGGRASFGGSGGACGGGGGGTFIINSTTNTQLLICGGGGGAAEGTPGFVASSIQPGVDASAYNNSTGGSGTGYADSWSTPGSGGTSGNGGSANDGGAGGGGYLGNGAMASFSGGIGVGYLNGGAGGVNLDRCGGGFITNIAGGFGGGAGAGICSAYEADAGGGGGYSGGGGSNTRIGAGGGGGNYYTGTYISSALNTGDGSVTITAPNYNALAFDGTSDYVSVPYSLNQSALTLEAWVKPNGTARQYVISNDNPGLFGAGFGLNNLQLEINCHNTFIAVPAATFTTGVWAHIAVVYNSSGAVQAYVNGTQVYNATPNASWTSSLNGLTTFLIGRHNSGLPLYWSGSIDEVRVWSRSLCQGEIQNNMNGELPILTTQTGLAAYYTMDQGIASGDNTAISTLMDGSGNGNTGTLNTFDRTAGNSTSNFVTGVSAITGTVSQFTNPAPATPVVTTPGGATSVCAGSSLVLSTTAVAGYTYQWANGGTAISGATANPYTATAAGSYTVTATNTCGASATSAATVITQNPQPQGSLTANGPFIASGNGQLTFTATAGTGPFTVVYNDGTANRTATNVVSGTAFTPFTNPVTATTTYTLVSVADANCTRTASFTGSSATINVTQYNGLAFDGVNNYVASTNNIGITGAQPRTIEYWSNLSTNFDHQVDWGTTGTTYGVFGTYTNNGGLLFYGWGAGDFVTGFMPDGAMHHVAVTYDGTYVRVYVDGNLTPAGAVARPLNTGAGKVYIGVREDLNAGTFAAGTFDEVRVWNRALCQSEIQNNMNGELPNPATQTGLVLNYRFDQGIASGNNTSITSATDASASANNGALTNFALTGSTSNFVTGTVTTMAAPFTNPAPATPVVTTTGGATSFCAGSSIVLTTPVVSGYTYQWNVGGTAISAATANTYTATTAGSYTVRVTNNCGASATSAATVITVNPIPTATATPSTQTICNSSAITAIALTSNVAGTTYAWTTNNNTNVTGTANAGGSGNSISGSLTSTSTTAQTVTFTITPSTASCTGTPVAATVTVNPTPTVNTVPDQALCAGSATAAVAFSGAVTGTYYTWTNNAPSIGLAASGTGNIPSFTATNSTAAPVAATITVTPMTGASGTQTFTYTGVAQPWTVPAGVTSISVVAKGAQGGNGGGLGSNITGTVSVTPGDVLNIIVGGQGTSITSADNSGGGGGGGTFVVSSSGNVPLVVAGGGGGRSTAAFFPDKFSAGTTNGQTATSGGSTGSGGGTSGNGGLYGTSDCCLPGNKGASGGGGQLTNGQKGSTNTSPTGGDPGLSYLNGAAAGTGRPVISGYPTSGGNGGFGGGAGATWDNVVRSGGGGGYSGGQGGTAEYQTTGSWYLSGGGGGSYNAGTNQTNSVGNTGNGLVTISYSVPPTCSGPSKTFTITVNPLPIVYNVTGTGGYCSGSAGMPVGLSGSQSGVNYQLKLNGTTTGIPVAGTGSAISFGNQTAGTYTVSAVNVTTNCTSNMSGSAVVTVNPSPVFTSCPSSITTTTASNSCAATVTYTSTATNATSYSYAFSGATGGSGAGTGSGLSFNKGITTVVVTASTVNSCTATCTFTVTVNDNIPPTVVNLPTNISVSNDPGVCGAIVTWTAPTAADNCSSATIAQTAGPASGSTFAVGGPVTITYVATDASGNTSGPQSFTVTVTDNEHPVFTTVPANITVNCQDNTSIAALGNAAAIDNCNMQSLTSSDVSTQGVFANSANYYNYTITRTWTATDIHSLTTTASQVITVQDVTAPTLTTPAAFTQCNNATGNNLTRTATATDACSSPLTYAWTISGATTGNGTGAAVTASFGVGTSTISWTVSDVSGNTSAAATSTVTINPLPTVSFTSTDPLCNGSANGSINAIAAGGTPGYSYLWTPGGQTTANRTGLTAGTYTVQVTDLNSCQVTGSRTLNQPAVLSAGTLTGTYAIPGCTAYNIYLGYGATNDTISTAASGGTAPYTYAWTAAGTTIQTTKRVVTPAATTTYTATITDGHGCTTTGSYQVKVQDVHCGPAYIGRERNTTVSICHGGTLMCVSPAQAATHLSHGDCFGPCDVQARGVAGGNTGTEGGMNTLGGTISVYPNPAHSEISVSLTDMGGVWKAYQVVDLTGRLVAERHLEDALVQDVLKVDVSTLVPGVYLIRIVGEGGMNPVARFTVQ